MIDYLYLIFFSLFMQLNDVNKTCDFKNYIFKIFIYLKIQQRIPNSIKLFKNFLEL